MPIDNPVINPAYVAALREFTDRSAYPRLNGMRLTAVEIDRSEVELTIDGERHHQLFGIVHGGVLATLIDTATYWSTFLRLPADAGQVNVDLKLNYLQSATTGRLRAVGRCVRAGRTLSYAEASVYDERDALVAHGTSTLMALPGKGITVDVPKFLE